MEMWLKVRILNFLTTCQIPRVLKSFTVHSEFVQYPGWVWGFQNNTLSLVGFCRYRIQREKIVSSSNVWIVLSCLNFSWYLLQIAGNELFFHTYLNCTCTRAVCSLVRRQTSPSPVYHFGSDMHSKWYLVPHLTINSKAYLTRMESV